MSVTGYIEIDLGALARNYAVLADRASPGSSGAVVKAGAYGLGVAPVAVRLRDAGCRHFFVATPAEGIELRSLLPDETIFVLHGLCGVEREALLAARLVPVLNTLSELKAWGAAGPAAVHIDTGMSRLGLAAADVAAISASASDYAAVEVQYVMTHLACADEPDHALNRVQLEAFGQLREIWPDAKTSIGNSAGLFLGSEFASDLARPGLALYGVCPLPEALDGIEPVVEFKARILQLRQIDAGQSVGYGASFVAESPMRLATVGVGYADGYLRSLGNRGIASVAGHRVPVVGRVSMDLVCLDVSGVPGDQLAEGDWVTMMGGDIAINELAELAGTISYELLTGLGPRIERRYFESNG